MSSQMPFGFPEPFSGHVTDLRFTSVDKSRVDGGEAYLTNLRIPAVDFDSVKDEYHRVSLGGLPSEQPKSVDAILFSDNGSPVFVEFKNDRIDIKTQYGLRGKLYDSVIIYCDVMRVSPSDLRDEGSFELVYNETRYSTPDISESTNEMHEGGGLLPSFSREAIARAVCRKAGKQFVRFGLERFKGYCFKDISSVPIKHFMDCLKELSVSVE